MSKAIIALGSNLGKSDEHLNRALSLISSRVGRIASESRRHSTTPLLNPEFPTLDQNRYMNMIVVVDTALTPDELLHECLEIERVIGRVRTPDAPKWGPRVIDLDIISIDDATIDTPQLTLPHKEMHKRSFVLDPLAEIWPDWVHPVLGLTALELSRRLNGRNMP